MIFFFITQEECIRIHFSICMILNNHLSCPFLWVSWGHLWLYLGCISQFFSLSITPTGNNFGQMTVDFSRVDHTVLYFWPFCKIGGCSSQLPNVPQWSLLPCIHVLGFHPTWSRADLCKRVLLSETEIRDSIIKPVATPILLFWIPCPGQASGHLLKT